MNMTRESLSGELDIENSVRLAARQNDECIDLEASADSVARIVAAEKDQLFVKACVWAMVAFVVGVIIGAIVGRAIQAGKVCDLPRNGERHQELFHREVPKDRRLRIST